MFGERPPQFRPPPPPDLLHLCIKLVMKMFGLLLSRSVSAHPHRSVQLFLDPRPSLSSLISLFSERPRVFPLNGDTAQVLLFNEDQLQPHSIKEFACPRLLRHGKTYLHHLPAPPSNSTRQSQSINTPPTVKLTIVHPNHQVIILPLIVGPISSTESWLNAYPNWSLSFANETLSLTTSYHHHSSPTHPQWYPSKIRNCWSKSLTVMMWRTQPRSRTSQDSQQRLARP